VADQQQTAVGRQSRQRIERLACAEPAGQGRMHVQAFALAVVPLLGGQLGRLLSARLGAEQHRIEAGVDPRQGGACGACLSFAPDGQPALCIRARPVRLGLGMT